MSRSRLLVLAASFLALHGCAIPLFPKCGGWLKGEGRCFDGKSISFIVPGETTKDDVVGRLGFPSRVLRDGAVYGYDWEMPSWLVVLAGGNTATGGIVDKNHVFLVEFDGGGRVVRQLERSGYFFPGSEFPVERAPEAAEPPAEP